MTPQKLDKIEARQWMLIAGAIFGLLCVLTLYGCTTLPIDYAKLSADQIKEIVKDKGIMAQCSTVNSPYGRGIVVVVGIDQITTTSGTPKP